MKSVKSLRFHGYIYTARYQRYKPTAINALQLWSPCDLIPQSVLAKKLELPLSAVLFRSAIGFKVSGLASAVDVFRVCMQCVSFS